MGVFFFHELAIQTKPLWEGSYMKKQLYQSIIAFLFLTVSLNVYASTMDMIISGSVPEPMSSIKEKGPEIGLDYVYCSDGETMCQDGQACCISGATGYACGCCRNSCTSCSCSEEACYGCGNGGGGGSPSCVLNSYYEGDEDSLKLFRKFRDNVLQKSLKGKFFTRAYYDFSNEIIKLLNENPDLQNKAIKISEYFLSALASRSKKISFSAEQTEEINSLLTEMQKTASPGLSRILRKLGKEIDNQFWLNHMGIILGSELK
jgi:hypothetical protein